MGASARTAMEQTLNRREWLEWLTRVRLLMITLILGVGVVWPQYVPRERVAVGTSCRSSFCGYTLAILHLILVRLLPRRLACGALQVFCDVAMMTGIVYATGLQDSNFTSLYLLVIIVASILFTRRMTFVTAGLCLASLALAGRSGGCREVAANFDCARLGRDAATVDSEQYVWISCRGLSWRVCWRIRLRRKSTSWK